MPNPGPQTRFLASTASECLYGGSAGGGKSAGLIAQPLRWISNGAFRALYLRREATYLGDAVDKSSVIYPALGGRLRMSPRIEWVFPSGARVWFSHCEHENDVKNYDSFEFHLVLFDELTHFSERQYRGIRARIRGTDSTLPRWTRAATNPGGEGHDWVFARFAPWLDPAYKAPAKQGELRYFVGEDEVPRGTPLALSRTFIPARLEDNPKLSPEYRAQLAQLDPVRRAQLELGDWLKKPSAKTYWDSARVTHVDSIQGVAKRVRAWDFAGSISGDYSATVRAVLEPSGVVTIEHAEHRKTTPEQLLVWFGQLAEADPKGTEHVIPRDPGQAGKFQVAAFQAAFPKLAVRERIPSGDKATRFSPVSARHSTGAVRVLRGPWNKAFHEELEGFPEGKHDDLVDATSDAYAECVTGSSASFLAAMKKL